LFELQYHQLLFTSGVIGVFIVAGAGLAAWVGIRRAAAARPEHVPVLVASTVAAVALLIVNASNPYLQAVGHGWGLALVVGVANALLDNGRPDHPMRAPGAESRWQKYSARFGDQMSKASGLARGG
jgi:hypothetical protein